MKNVKVEFNILYGNEKIPPEHHFMRCHMIFDININTFKSKSGYVAGTQMTETPSSITYTIVVSHEIICIELMVDALNDLDVFTSDVQNKHF